VIGDGFLRQNIPPPSLKEAVLSWFYDDPQPTKDLPMHDNAPMTEETVDAAAILAYEKEVRELRAAANALPELAPGESAFVEVPPRPEPEQQVRVKLDPTPKIDAITDEDLKKATEIEYFIKGACFGGDLPRLPWVDEEHAHAVAALVEAYGEARILAHELVAVHENAASEVGELRKERDLYAGLYNETSKRAETGRAAASALHAELRDVLKSVTAERDHLRQVYEIGLKDRGRMIEERNQLTELNQQISARNFLHQQRAKDFENNMRRLQREISKLKKFKARVAGPVPAARLSLARRVLLKRSKPRR
jgi:hypothetical protein